MKLLHRLLPAVTVTLFLISGAGSVSAQTCFESSPSVKIGIDPFSPQKIPEITAPQYEAIENILTTAEGKWSGKMVIKECLGAVNSPRIVEEAKDVKAVAEYSNGHMKIKLDMYSHKKKMKQTDAIEYFLSDNRFSVDPSDHTGDVEVRIAGSAVIFYMRRQNFAGKGNLAKEILTKLEAAPGQLIIKELLYVNGALVSESVMTLQ